MHKWTLVADTRHCSEIPILKMTLKESVCRWDYVNETEQPLAVCQTVETHTVCYVSSLYKVVPSTSFPPSAHLISDLSYSIIKLVNNKE